MSDHLSQMTHDLQNVERFTNQVVFSFEKNCDGDNGIAVEFDE